MLGNYVCVPEAHAIDGFKCFLNSLHLMLRYNCLFSMLLQLKGLLRFQMIQNISQMSDCVQLYHQTTAWFDMPVKSSTKANATWIRGVQLATISKGNGTIPSQPRWAPFLRGVCDSLPPWTSCQSRKVDWAVKNYFYQKIYMQQNV